jgi:hypothetical protein
MEKHLMAYYAGIAFVFITHGQSLFSPDTPLFTFQQFNYGNIAAACLIAYYFLNKEGKIDW